MNLTRALVLAVAAAGSSAALVAAPRVASACGGCFSPPETITAVEAHRMVIALSTTQTTLWDQIRYSGDPEDFVWVLPVPDAMATIALAAPEFFDVIDSQSAPQVQAPPIFCPVGGDTGGGFGCGTMSADSAASDDDSANEPPTEGVTVYDTETVGPYETVTIGAEDANALYTWLNEHGYAVPVETVPTIEWYVQQQHVFVVMRLAPGKGVEAMQPVRVRYPGYMATFPLKMVTVGAYGAVDLSLWVIAEQRYETGNYTTVRIDPAALVWDFALGRSNYGQLFGNAIDAAGGRAWVVEHAVPFDQFYFDAAAADDVTEARAGQPYPYVTRLRSRMLIDHLTDDLELRPAADASQVSNFLQVQTALNAPVCPPVTSDEEGTCAVAISGRARAALAPLGLGLLLLVAMRARRRRTRSHRA